MAKDILLADSIEDVGRVMVKHPPSGGQLKLEAIDPGVAAGQIHAAMALTDNPFEPQVGEDYAGLRALALMRGDETPGYVAARERAAVPQSARDRSRDEFLSSPEGTAFAPDSDEAYIASLAIDFCADYVDGRPLRWSPVLVELFMVGWIPRKVLAAPQLFQKVPAALEAWVRFAGRKTAKPTWAIEATHNAIHHWQEELIRAVGDPAAASPAKRLLTRAREDLVHARVALTNQLRAELERFWPGPIGLFTKLDSAISLAFLERYPSPADARGLGEQRLAGFLARQRYSGHKQPGELLAKLRRAPEGRVGEVELAARRALVLALVAAIGPLVDQIKQLDRQIATALREHPDGAIFLSLFS